MKFFAELTAIENRMYELDKLRVCLNILSRTEEMNDRVSDFNEDYKTFIFDIEDRMTENMKSLKKEFQALWDVVRNDGSDEQKAKENFDRWAHIVSDLQKWNDDNMSKSNIPSGAVDDTITIVNIENPINVYPSDLDTSRVFDDEWLHLQRMNNQK